MKRNTFSINLKRVKPAMRKGLAFLLGGLVITLAAVMSSGCSLAEKPSNEPIAPEPPELTYSISVSAAPIQISSGNLHWHRELPDESYTLENVALEIHNLGDFDIAVAQLEITVDDETRLLDIDQVIAGGARESLDLQPMMGGFDGGVHRVYMSLLDDNGRVLYRNQGEDIGPLEPEPGTGSWHSMPSCPSP
jgi:hypothetical protein